MAKATGGPAFPVVSESGVGHAAAFRGMTLRDWFAGQALAGMLAASPSETGLQARSNALKAAVWAYEFADAMIEEREK